MAECVKVIVRCRPMNSRENALKCKNVVLMDADRCTCSLINPNDNFAPPKTFTFDGVYYVNSTTENIYNEITYPLVEGVLEGYNSTVFAYGQTGCGKSFSMQGVEDPPSQRGIIPRAFEHIFEAISLVENIKYLILASYLEIYNEEIRDLLASDHKKKLDLKENGDRGIYVNDLSQHAVSNVAECQELMDKGWCNRSTGATLMNADSSRSHSIFSITIEMMPLVDCLEASPIRRGKLNLVDLAGSERQGKTGATGERLKEATKINLSLSALGNVISALVDGKARHIPYRDSKLTRLLQDSLGGNTKTLMVACLSPADNNYDETLTTLRYANRAKNICNQPHINEDPKDTMLREYQEEIKKLKAMLEASDIPQTLSQNVDDEMLEREKQKVYAEYEKEMAILREQFNAMQTSKCQVQADLLDLKKQYEQDIARINSQSQAKQHSAPTAVANAAQIVEKVLNSDNTNIGSAQQEILSRLQKLQASMVGGERSNDNALKEKRLNRKRAAERRLNVLAQILARVKDDDNSGLVLGVYDDIQDEMRTTLRKHKQKIRALEREISDLQCEFENERTDYLETIRRQDHQIKLNQQILEKVIPTLKKECNYRGFHNHFPYQVHFPVIHDPSNLDSVKSEAQWSEDAQAWILPELYIHRTKLPPPGRFWGARSPSQTAPGRLEGGTFTNLAEIECSPSRTKEKVESKNSVDALTKKLQRSEEEDFAGNYFKPRRATELLIKAKEDAGRIFNKWKDNNNTKSNGVSSLSSSYTSSGLISSLNSMGNSLPGQAFLNNSWGAGQSPWLNNGNNLSPEISRRPIKLEALPINDRKPNRMKGGLNTLDVI